MVNPLISIVVPVYNAEDTIESCIKSLLRQTYEEIEIIVINDGSSDNSLRKCEKFLNEKKMKIINKNNQGVSHTRNQGIDIANGEYICFVDSDDTVDENYVMNMYKAMDKDIDLVICNYRTIDLINNTSFNSSLPAQKYAINDVIKNYWNFFEMGLINAPWNKIFKMSIIKEFGITFPENIPLGEDGNFVNNYLMHSSKIKVIKDILYSYYQYSGQSSKLIQKNYFQIMMKNLNTIENLLHKELRKNKKLYHMHCKAYFNICHYSIVNIIKNDDIGLSQKKYEIKNIIYSIKEKDYFNHLEGLNHKEKFLKKVILKENYFFILLVYNFYFKRGFLWKKSV